MRVILKKFLESIDVYEYDNKYEILITLLQMYS